MSGVDSEFQERVRRGGARVVQSEGGDGPPPPPAGPRGKPAPPKEAPKETRRIYQWRYFLRNFRHRRFRYR